MAVGEGTRQAATKSHSLSSSGTARFGRSNPPRFRLERAAGGYTVCPAPPPLPAPPSAPITRPGPFEQSVSAELWDEFSSWSLQPTPAPTSTTSSSLNAVWCFENILQRRRQQRHRLGRGTLAESWDGTELEHSDHPKPKRIDVQLPRIFLRSWSSNGRPRKAVGSSEDETLIESVDDPKWSFLMKRR